MRPLEVLHKSIETNKLGHAILLESKNCKTLSETAESLASKILKTDALHSHPDFLPCALQENHASFALAKRKIETKETYLKIQ